MQSDFQEAQVFVVIATLTFRQLSILQHAYRFFHAQVCWTYPSHGPRWSCERAVNSFGPVLQSRFSFSQLQSLQIDFSTRCLGANVVGFALHVVLGFPLNLSDLNQADLLSVGALKLSGSNMFQLIPRWTPVFQINRLLRWRVAKLWQKCEDNILW